MRNLVICQILLSFQLWLPLFTFLLWDTARSEVVSHSLGISLVLMGSNLYNLCREERSKPQCKPCYIAFLVQTQRAVKSVACMYFWLTNIHFPFLKSRSQGDREMVPLCVNIQLDPTLRAQFQSVDPSYADFQ